MGDYGKTITKDTAEGKFSERFMPLEKLKRLRFLLAIYWDLLRKRSYLAPFLLALLQRRQHLGIARNHIQVG